MKAYKYFVITRFKGNIMTEEARAKVVATRTVPFNPVRPIYFMHTPDITPDEKHLALETLDEILDIAGIRGEIPVNDLGVWRQPNYRRHDGQLAPHMSVDWYVDRWLDQQRRQVNASEGAAQLLFDPWNEEEPHYDVILTAQDLYTPETNFVVGVAHRRRGTITSVKMFRYMKDKGMEREAKKQELFHEVGHVFGLPDEKRGFDLEYSLGAHCTNSCALRQGLSVPRDWIGFANDRLATGQVYCEPCTEILRAYFGK